jgi:hypothetical protein
LTGNAAALVFIPYQLCHSYFAFPVTHLQIITMKTAAAFSAIIALANAHATWQQLWKNGEDLESTCARLPPSNSPIEDYTSTALQCE